MLKLRDCVHVDGFYILRIAPMWFSCSGWVVLVIPGDSAWILAGTFGSVWKWVWYITGRSTLRVEGPVCATKCPLSPLLAPTSLYWFEPAAISLSPLGIWFYFLISSLHSRARPSGRSPPDKSIGNTSRPSNGKPRIGSRFLPPMVAVMVTVMGASGWARA